MAGKVTTKSRNAVATFVFVLPLVGSIKVESFK